MKAFCMKCGRITHHTSLKELSKDFDWEDAGFYEKYTWQIIQCNGCEEVSFRMVYINSDDVDPEGVPSETIRLYPMRGKDILSLKSYYNAPVKIRSIYREIIDAYNNGLYILSAGGLRAIIEGICNDEGIIDGPIEIIKSGVKTIKRKRNLQGKISGLHEKGLLTKQHAELLHEHRFLGNEALHSLDKPTKDELRLAIEIVEHTLDNIYELSEKVEDLQSRKRNRTKKT